MLVLIIMSDRRYNVRADRQELYLCIELQLAGTRTLS